MFTPIAYTPAERHIPHTESSCVPKTLILLKTDLSMAPNKGRGERKVKKRVFYLKQVGFARGQRELDPAQRVPHGHGLPQSGQHLVPVGDPHPAGFRADDHMAEVLAPAVVCGLCHCHPQREFLQTAVQRYTNCCVRMTQQLLYRLFHPDLSRIR